MADPQPLAPDELRVGDAERSAVDARLHRAVGDGLLTLTEYDERARDVWAARTRGELSAVVRDLPGADVRPVAAPGAPAVRRSVAVMGEERLTGPVAPGQQVQGYAVMGSTRLDLARDDLPGEVSVRAVAVMGEVQVVVPDGAHVDLTGIAVMGERSVRTAPAAPGAPVVHLHGVAVMGSVTVRSALPSAAPVPAAGAFLVAPPVRRGGVVRRRRLRRSALAGALVLGLGLAAGHNGHHGPGGLGDRTFVLPTDGTVFQLPGGVGDLRIVVPDGYRVDDSGVVGGVGDVECKDHVCTRPGTVVRVTGSRLGDIDFVAADD